MKRLWLFVVFNLAVFSSLLACLNEYYGVTTGSSLTNFGESLNYGFNKNFNLERQGAQQAGGPVLLQDSTPAIVKTDSIDGAAVKHKPVTETGTLNVVYIISIFAVLLLLVFMAFRKWRGN